MNSACDTSTFFFIRINRNTEHHTASTCRHVCNRSVRITSSAAVTAEKAQTPRHRIYRVCHTSMVRFYTKTLQMKNLAQPLQVARVIIALQRELLVSWSQPKKHKR